MPLGNYFKATLKFFFSWEMSILSSRASQPKANPTSSPEPLSLFFSWANVCGPKSSNMCQTLPAVTPTYSFISTFSLPPVYSAIAALNFRVFCCPTTSTLHKRPPSLEDEASYPLIKREDCCRESPAYGEVNLWYNSIERLD